MTTGQTQVIEPNDATVITCDFLAFSLDKREFALPLDKVCELRMGSEVVACDGEDDGDGNPSDRATGVVGILTRHDGEIEVVDAHAILSLPSMCSRTGFDVIVIRSAGKTFGLAVDDATDVVTLPVEEFMLVTSPMAERNPIWAITMHEERVLRLLDPDSLIVEKKTPRAELLEELERIEQLDQREQLEPLAA